ncbi:MAG TPA: transcriptional repressor [Candidatus Agrococcus pullicola]|uniref:Transcriptional repressor n=1 Tax=Candidatus Agrococcus pullicola TaxID=2838429 RepID=A0A9D1YX89_9MICO|nr:transcriptional repressor [Candidatus Agrococcus pullicola]
MSQPQRRKTWQRAAVQEALEATAEFVSAQTLHARMRDTGSPIGLTTVYRALATLAEHGDADSLQSEGEQLYRACSPKHHHHLICRSCGLTVEIEAKVVEQWAREVASEHRFTDASHVVDVFGVCVACRRKAE